MHLLHRSCMLLRPAKRQKSVPICLTSWAENAGLRDQLKSKDSEIEFLREEVRTARDQRGAVVQISNRMLETLETIAIGGRLARPKGDAGDQPVRYPTQQSGSDAV